MRTRRFIVDAATAGTRLDRYLTDAVGGEFSRSRLQALIEEGCVTVADAPATSAKRKLSEGESVEIALPEPEDPEPQAEAIALDIVYEDSQLVVIDKPAGLVVHPGPGNWTGTLVNALLHHCGDSLSGIGGVKRPGIVHRLDKDTSGLLVVAKTDLAHKVLSSQFAAHGKDGRLARTYLAVVWGVPDRVKGRVEAALGRSSSDRVKRAVVPENRPDARHAATDYELLSRAAEPENIAALVECRLETGRTHQIRVHMAHIGHPLIGDDLYGAGFKTKPAKLEPEPRAVVEAFSRQALHATRLGFEHPETGERLDFLSPPPEDFRHLLDALRLNLAPGLAERRVPPHI